MSIGGRIYHGFTVSATVPDPPATAGLILMLTTSDVDTVASETEAEAPGPDDVAVAITELFDPLTSSTVIAMAAEDAVTPTLPFRMASSARCDVQVTVRSTENVTP